MPSAGALAAKASGQIPSLDGIRALSILIVFIGHAGLPQVLRDQTGVTIFFFLSGYLITTLLVREKEKRGKISIRGFYLRRVFRILPAMYFVLAVAIVVNILQLLPSTMTLAGAGASAMQLTNYWIVLFGREDLPTGMNALWSLNVEEHYYLFFPVLFIGLTLLFRRRSHQAFVLGAICVAFLAWRIVLAFGLDAGFDRIYLATDTRADSILWGAVFAIAWNPVHGNAIARGRWPWAQLALGIALLACARVMPNTLAITLGYTVEAVGLMFIFTAVITAPTSLFGRVLNWKPLAYLGVLSYSMYLCHRLVLLLVEKYVGFGMWIDAILSLAITVGASYGIYKLVEHPMIRFGRRFQPHLEDRTIAVSEPPHWRGDNVAH